MGNIVSYTRGSTGRTGAKNTMSETRDSNSEMADSVNDCDSDNESVNQNVMTSETRKLSPLKEKEMEEFRKELAEKREARKKIIKEKSNEMNALKESLENEKKLREELMEENNKLRQQLVENNSNVDNQEASQRRDDSQLKLAVEELENQVDQLKTHLKDIRSELSESNLSLQNVNGEMSLINKENVELRKQIAALKDVNKVSKEMMNLRETQITQLKDKLTLIEESLADREMRTMSTELRQEYERQLQNIRSLRVMYEERSRLAEVTRLSLVRELDLRKSENDNILAKNTDLEARNVELENLISEKVDIIGSQESQLGLCKADIRGLQAEMSVVNQLFSQMLMGYNPSQDLDKLVTKLEENHDLLKDVVYRGEGAEGAAALPRMLLDLLNQVDDKGCNVQGNIPEEENILTEINDDVSASAKAATASAQEIVGNLPKVWRVLMELLSHQTTPSLSVSENSSESCYKSVETPSGPRLVPSVSKTYIRLKDLILEKKTLQKETYRLKQLNSHLECRLQDHERRLSLVSSELSKTWRIVGKMQRAHQQLHTHEKILRYELQQKRKMLTELKEQLEFCKEKWDKAKQKNSQSQIEWDKLRLEFASRKLASVESVNNSAESGYSDEKPSDTSDSSDEEDISERRRTKRKTKSPEVEVAVNPTINLLRLEDQNDSDVIQDEEELPLESTDVLSDGDSQANLADTEDQSISESVSAEDNNAAQIQSQDSCIKDIIQAGSEKLKKLEKKCCVLATKVEKVNNEGVELCSKLEQLQNQYGGGGTDTPSTSEDAEQANVENNLKIDDQTDSAPESILENSQENPEAGSSGTQGGETNKYILEYEARFAARDARLKMMEEQTKSLVKKMEKTSTRSVVINFKLDELHNVYGRSMDDQSGTNENSQDEALEDNTDTNEPMDAGQPGKVDQLECISPNSDSLVVDKDSEITENLESIAEKNLSQARGGKGIETRKNLESNLKCDTTVDKNNPIVPEDTRQTELGTCDRNQDGSSDAVSEYDSRRLEEQASALVETVVNTAIKSVEIEHKLDELQGTYGQNVNQVVEEDSNQINRVETRTADNSED